MRERMRPLLITVMLTCALILAGTAFWLQDLDLLYLTSPFLVTAYFATFKREELR
jgi:hypothetical protein